MTLKGQSGRLTIVALRITVLVNTYLRRFLPWSHSLLKSHCVTVDDRTDGESKPLLFGQSVSWPVRRWPQRNVYDGCPAFCLLYLGSNDGHAGDRDDFNSSNQELCGSWRKLHERWKCSPKVTAMVGKVPFGLANVMGVCYVWPIEFPYRNSSPQKELYFII